MQRIRTCKAFKVKCFCQTDETVNAVTIAELGTRVRENRGWWLKSLLEKKLNFRRSPATVTHYYIAVSRNDFQHKSA